MQLFDTKRPDRHRQIPRHVRTTYLIHLLRKKNANHGLAGRQHVINGLYLLVVLTRPLRLGVSAPVQQIDALLYLLLVQVLVEEEQARVHARFVQAFGAVERGGCVDDGSHGCVGFSHGTILLDVVVAVVDVFENQVL